MLRPAGPDAMAALRAAAAADDAALDRALLRVGILAPADLDAIREALTRPGTSLRATSNRDGHRIVDVIVASEIVARIHPDGAVSPTALV